MRRFVEDLYKVTDNIEDFMYLSTNLSRAAVERMDTALNNLVEHVARSDLKLVGHILTDYVIGYGSNHAIKAETTDGFMAGVFAMLPTYSRETDFHGYRQMIAGFIEFLGASLDTLSSVYLMSGGDTLKDAPIRMISDDTSSKKCRNLQQDIRIVLNNTLSDFVANWANETLFSQKSLAYNLSSMYRQFVVNKCANELVFKFNKLSNIVKDLDMHTERLLNKDSDFDNDDYLKSFEVDLNSLQNTVNWFTTKLSSYSQNQTTKIKLSNVMTKTMLDNIVSSLDHVISNIEMKVIQPLLSKTDGIKKNMKRLYRKVLEGTFALVPHYDDTGVEDKLRALNVWRHPEARLDTLDVLKFKYPASESWRSWGVRVSLGDFLASGNAATLVSRILEDYSHALQLEMLRIKEQYVNAKGDIIQAFTNLRSDLANIQTQSLMANDFVL